MADTVRYAAAGSRLVWMVDAEARRVVVQRPHDHVSTLSEADALTAEDVLPGFRCGLAELLA